MERFSSLRRMSRRLPKSSRCIVRRREGRKTRNLEKNKKRLRRKRRRRTHLHRLLITSLLLSSISLRVKNSKTLHTLENSPLKLIRWERSLNSTSRTKLRYILNKWRSQLIFLVRLTSQRTSLSNNLALLSQRRLKRIKKEHRVEKERWVRK